MSEKSWLTSETMRIRHKATLIIREIREEAVQLIPKATWDSEEGMEFSETIRSCRSWVPPEETLFFFPV